MSAPDIASTLIEPIENEVLELDELWSFVSGCGLHFVVELDKSLPSFWEIGANKAVGICGVLSLTITSTAEHLATSGRLMLKSFKRENTVALVKIQGKLIMSSVGIIRFDKESRGTSARHYLSLNQRKTTFGLLIGQNLTLP